MDSTSFIAQEWTQPNSYSDSTQDSYAPTGLFAPFEGTQKDGSSGDVVYGLFDSGRDLSAGYLHATPPSATPLRRARSSSAVLNINSSPSLPTSARQDISSPSSPLSDALQTPRDGQQLTGSSWFAAEQANFLNSLSASQPQQQQGSSPDLFASQLATPVSEVTLRERRRCPSAQPALPSQDSKGTSGRPVRGASYQGSNLSLAIPEARSAPMAQQPSIQEVNQFFSEMTEILGPSAMSAISPPAASFADLPTSPVYSSPSRPSTAGPTYQVNGVILDAEDYELYSRSPSNFQGQWPQSAPPTQTTFGAAYTRAPALHQLRRSPPPRMISQHSPFSPEYATSTGSFNPAYAPPRPRSAPASPDLGSVGVFAAFTHEGSFNPPPSHSSVYYPTPLRRGSSAGADSMPRSFPPHPQGSTSPYDSYSIQPQQPSSQYYQSQSQYHPQQQQRTPPRYGMPTPYYPSALAPSYDYQPPSPSQSPSSHPQLRRMSSVPVGLSVNPRPVAGLRKSSTRGSPKRGGGGVSFINFSSQDATKLLSGVAPSGSSKRKRDEEEARKQQKLQKVAEGC